MFWLIIIGVACYFLYDWYKGKRNNYTSNANVTSSSSMNTYRKQFPSDIYQAIETFARLCYQCKQATGWAYELDFATILVTHTAQGTKLELTCRGDSIACTLPSEYRWLRNDSDLNEIKYISDNVTGYVKENYASSKPTEADSLFYFYKQGDPHAHGESLWQKDNGDIVGMHISLH